MNIFSAGDMYQYVETKPMNKVVRFFAVIWFLIVVFFTVLIPIVSALSALIITKVGGTKLWTKIVATVTRKNNN